MNAVNVRQQLFRILAVFVAGICTPVLFAGTPVGYYASANTATSATLRSSLNDIVTSNAQVVNFFNSATSFGALDEIDEDSADPTKVRMIYSADTRGKHAVAGSSQDSNAATGGWNREHGFPQSFFDMDSSGDGDNPMVSDLHSLFPCDSDINTQRSNKTYDFVALASYTDIFGDRSNSTDFEPGSLGTNNSKGRVARAVLYMDVRYEGESGEPNLVVQDTGTVGTSFARMKYLSTLLLWHRQYPPDAFERTRNSKAYNIQKNANPFVDHPEWVATVYNDTAWSLENGTTLTVAGTNVAPASATAGTQNIPMMSLNLGVAGKEWHISQMSFSQIGTSTDAETSDVKVWHDLDNNGVAGTTDTLLATGTFSSGNSTVTFSDPFYLAKGTMNLLVTASPSAITADGKTLQIRLNGITHDASGGADIDPTFAPLSSGAVTVAGVGFGVKIAAVSTAGSDNVSSKEFIVLANQTGSAVTMTNWVIRRRSGASSTNNDMTFSGTIPAASHFLIGSNAYGSGVNAVEGATADFVDSNVNGLTGGLSNTATGVTIALYNTSAAFQLDAVSYTGGSSAAPTLHEGTAFSGSLNGLGQTKMLYRIRPADPGPYTDTDNNATDLSIVTKYGQVGAPRTSPPNSSIAVPVTFSDYVIE